MNTLLLEPEELASDGHARLTGRRLAHVRDVQRARVGDTLRVGVIGGLLGRARIEALDGGALVLAVELEREPPPPAPFSLLLALPRPPVLERALVAATSLGIKSLWIVNAWRVEKSYWGSPRLAPERLRARLRLGLELAGDTRLPRVELRKLFKPFAEDELPGLVGGARALVAHPGAERTCPRAAVDPAWLALGPEGGFLPYEIDKLAAAGFEPVSLGERVLSVETALAAFVSRVG